MHAIEILPEGRPALFYVNRPRPESWRPNPWGFAAGGPAPLSGQAATVDESAASSMTWSRAAELAGATWRVEARETFTTRSRPDANGKRALRVADERTLVRLPRPGFEATDPEYALKTVSDSYGVVQNEEPLALLSQVGVTPDSMAVLDDGRSLYAQAVVTDLQVRAGDTGRVREFLTAMWSHGLGAVKFGRTRVGIVCTNTYGHARGELQVSIRHSKGASAAVARLARSLETSASEAREWAETAKRLAETDARKVLGTMAVRESRSSAVSTPVADLLATALQGEPAKATDLHTRSLNVIGDVLQLMRDPKRGSGVVGDGSLWDLFQAASFYASHERTVRGQAGPSAEVARRVDSTPAWLGATWDALAALATDAAPVSVLVRS